MEGVRNDYTIIFSRYGRNKTMVATRTDAPGGREADAERFAAVIEALTGREPRIRRRSDGTIELKCGKEHLDGLARYAELADAIKKWLGETE
jgi:hypothetical protein